MVETRFTRFKASIAPTPYDTKEAIPSTRHATAQQDGVKFEPNGDLSRKMLRQRRTRQLL
jgi:hypothetical protein